MAAVPWPLTLPECAETWQEQDRAATVRTEMEDNGPPKVRRRYTGTVRQIQLTMMLTNAQKQEMQNFHRVNLAAGVLAHSFRDPYADAVQPFRFVEPPSFQSAGPLAVQMTARWEQFPGVDL
jgi:hypothetical protein